MNQERSTYRHPKHKQMESLLLEGLNDTEIARRLGVHNRSVTRVRDLLGLPHWTPGTSKLDKVYRCIELRPDDHTGWSGRRARNGRVIDTAGNRSPGTPVIRHLKIQIPASHVLFEDRAGRPPVGIVKAECDFPQCLTGVHLSDEIERRNIRAQERALHGLAAVPWDVCPAGTHRWEVDGRFEANLKPYCKSCNTERKASARVALLEARRAEGLGV